SSEYDVRTLVSRDHEDYCRVTDASTGGCAYYGINDEVKDLLPGSSPLTVFGDIVINTLKPDFTNQTHPGNHDFYFLPLSGDTDPRTFADFTSGVEDARKNVSIIIPSYISRQDFDNAIPSIIGVRLNGSDASCTHDPAMNLIDHTTALPAGNGCRYRFFPTERILKVGFASDFHTSQVGVKFTVATAPKSTTL